MPTFIPPGFCQATYVFSHNSYTYTPQVVTGWSLSGSDLDPTSIANSLKTAFASTMTARLDSEAYLERVLVTIGDDSDEPPMGESTSVRTQGSLSASTVPPGQAALVHKVTGRGGRRNKGRMYLPWVLDDTQVDDLGTISPAMIAALQPQLSQWKTSTEALASIDDAVILHSNTVYLTTRPSPGVKVLTRTPVVPPAPTVVTSWTLDPVVASQIRRQVRPS